MAAVNSQQAVLSAHQIAVRANVAQRGAADEMLALAELQGMSLGLSLHRLQADGQLIPSVCSSPFTVGFQAFEVDIIT